MDFDVIDEASAESFPASDPPTWATGQGRSVGPMDDSLARELRADQVISIEHTHHATKEDRSLAD